jgi:hypothetical protein
MGRRRSNYRRSPDYGAEWRFLSDIVLQRDPTCQICRNRRSTVVDHVRPRRAGGSESPEANLWGLCKPCHSMKTAMFDGGGGNRRGRSWSAVSPLDSRFLARFALDVLALVELCDRGGTFAAESSKIGGAGPFCTKLRAVVVCRNPDGRRLAFWAACPSNGGRKRQAFPVGAPWIGDNRRPWSTLQKQLLEKAGRWADRLNRIAEAVLAKPTLFRLIEKRLGR